MAAPHKQAAPACATHDQTFRWTGLQARRFRHISGRAWRPDLRNARRIRLCATSKASGEATGEIASPPARMIRTRQRDDFRSTPAKQGNDWKIGAGSQMCNSVAWTFPIHHRRFLPIGNFCNFQWTQNSKIRLVEKAAQRLNFRTRNPRKYSLSVRILTLVYAIGNSQFHSKNCRRGTPAVESHRVQV